MKIKIFTNHFYPENFRLNDLSKSFVEKGHDVSVVTQTPNYPEGRFFPSYSWLKRRKEKLSEKLTVHRLPVIPRGKNPIMLALNYISYIISSFFYGLFSRGEADVVFIYITSPIFIAWSALRFAKRRNIRTVLYLLDLWPDVLFTMLDIENEKVRQRLIHLCQKIYQRVDYIFVSSESFKDVLIGYGIDESKIYYLPQHAEEIPKTQPKRNIPDDILKIVFTGNIGEAQGLDILVETAKILSEQDIHDIHFTLVGNGRYRETLEEKIATANVASYFTFTGSVPFKEIPSILSKHHFGFVSLLPDETLNRTLPAKVQTYMAYGIPVLAAANDAIPKLLKEAQCGYASPAGDAPALALKLIEMRSLQAEKMKELSKNAYTYSKAYFKKEKSVEILLETMEGFINV